ncbi:hypothetical protein OIU77_017192 [Salix suchowensis]|uniref:Lipoxygenase domain-containing protein n=1 Tax=Salix suchowensis TaxID=1278906 RepID=A0ABQ8ZNH4_9ROSI|nr:hypothetical protein OIU77_017192 [Salix suchowensis]
MAVEDPTAKHGLKLTIKDYPFANDGRILWAAMKQWVSDYVDHYYPETSMVKSDKELQAWWTEANSCSNQHANRGAVRRGAEALLDETRICPVKMLPVTDSGNQSDGCFHLAIHQMRSALVSKWSHRGKRIQSLGLPLKGLMQD